MCMNVKELETWLRKLSTLDEVAIKGDILYSMRHPNTFVRVGGESLVEESDSDYWARMKGRLCGNSETKHKGLTYRDGYVCGAADRLLGVRLHHCEIPRLKDYVRGYEDGVTGQNYDGALAGTATGGEVIS